MVLSGLPTSGMHYLHNIPISVKDSAMCLVVNVDYALKFHQHIQKPGGMAQSLLKSTVNHASFLVPLYVMHI